MLRVVFPNTLNPMNASFEFIQCCVSNILEGDIHRFGYQMYRDLYVDSADNG